MCTILYQNKFPGHYLRQYTYIVTRCDFDQHYKRSQIHSKKCPRCSTTMLSTCEVHTVLLEYNSRAIQPAKINDYSIRVFCLDFKWALHVTSSALITNEPLFQYSNTLGAD